MSNEINAMDEQIDALLNSEKPVKNPKKSKKKKFFIIGGVIVVLLILFVIISSLMGGGQVGMPVEATFMRKGDIEETLIVNGPVEGTDSVDITSDIHAKITALHIKEGDRVEAGVTLLAEIDSKTIQKSIDTAQGVYDLKSAQKSEKEKSDKAAYAKASSDQEAAQKNYNRTAELAAAGAVSSMELEKALQALNDAKSVMAGFNIKNGKVVAGSSFDIDIENSQREIDNLKEQLDNTQLKAPISGIVTRVNTRVGQFADMVENRKPLITIENLDELRMNLLVSEYSIGKVEIGQEVDISADILGEGNIVKGEIMSISPTGQLKGDGSTERVIPVKVKILDKDTKLISGISAKATIRLASAKDSIIVPIAAIGDDGTGKKVMQFIVKDEAGKDVIAVKEVKTGVEGSIDVELIENPMGETVIEEVRFVSSYEPSLVEGSLVTVQQ